MNKGTIASAIIGGLIGAAATFAVGQSMQAANAAAKPSPNPSVWKVANKYVQCDRSPYTCVSELSLAGYRITGATYDGNGEFTVFGTK